MNEKHVCCICGKEFTGYGNNPDSWSEDESWTVDDRCCDDCNQKIVIPRRIAVMMSRAKQYGS